MKKTLIEKPKINLSMNGWLIIESFFIICGSICIYLLSDYARYLLSDRSTAYEPLAAIGMLLPMCILLGCLSYAFSRSLSQYTKEILDGIVKISDGEFQVKLDESRGGPLKDIYHKFNVMTDELSGIELMRNDFINEFSHEFKTPLASINGFSHLLLEGNCSPEETRRYLSIIAKESEHLVSLTQSQLLLSRLESQQIVAGKQQFLLDEQIRQCIILLSSKWEEKKLQISLELDSIPFYGNADLLQHIWMNLLENAVKYTPEGGEISVYSQQSGDSVSIFIKDTGIGIPQDELPHIFGKYYRAGVSGRTLEKGLGLGLSIVKRIVDISQGSIDVTSREGEGSTFCVTLPRLL